MSSPGFKPHSNSEIQRAGWRTAPVIAGGGLFYFFKLLKGVGFGPNLTNRLKKLTNNQQDLKSS